MLSCDEVREALPAIESGEAADGSLRDHLASCDSCREEGERLRADLRRLRADLSALAPSPLVEDAVANAARDATERALPGRPASWKPVLVTLAVASVLVAVILATGLGSDTPPEPENETARGDRDFVVMDLIANGRLFVDGRHTFYLLQPDGSPAARADLAWITEEIQAIVDSRADRDEQGTSKATVYINAQAETPWRLVQWLMQMCAHPEVRVSKIRFRVLMSGEPPFRNDLPTDQGLAADPPFMESVQKLKVRLFHLGDATLMKTAAGDFELGRGHDDVVLSALMDLARQVLAEAGPAARAEIAAPPPKGGRVPYVHVWMITRTLRAAGFEQVLFEGAAMPR